MASAGHQHDGLSSFIEDLERSAKKILKAANIKRREEKRIEQSVAIMQGRKVKGRGDKREKEFEFVDTSSQFQDLINNKLNFQVPVMSVSVSTTALDASADWLQTGLGSVTKPGSLSPLKPTSASSGQARHNRTELSKSAEFNNAPSNGAAVKRNLTLEKLQSSPFLGSGASLDEMLVNLKQSRQVKPALPTTESAWELKLQAASVLGGKSRSNNSSANALHAKLLENSKKAAPLVKGEGSGLMDWTYKGLKSKYRSEADREALYQAHISAQSLAQQAFEDVDYIVPVVPVERHPMIAKYEGLCEKVNWGSVVRSRKRLNMKRFMQNVREVWLTNLQHIREHNPETILEQGLADYSGSGQASPNDPMRSRGLSPTIFENDSEVLGASGVGLGADEGLSERRDVAAILGLEPQLQSVSAVRASRALYQPASLFPTKIVLDYVPSQTPYLEVSPPHPPTMEDLVVGFPLAMLLNEDQQHEHNLGNINAGAKKRERRLVDDDVMINISRLVPSLDMLQTVERLYEQMRHVLGPPPPARHKAHHAHHHTHLHGHAHPHTDAAAAAAHGHETAGEAGRIEGGHLAHNDVGLDHQQHHDRNATTDVSHVPHEEPSNDGDVIRDLEYLRAKYSDFRIDEKTVNLAIGDGSALEIWWRIEVCRRSDMKSIACYAKESDVVNYVARVIGAQGPTSNSSTDLVSVYEASNVSLARSSASAPHKDNDNDSNEDHRTMVDIVVSVSKKSPPPNSQPHIKDIVDITIDALVHGSDQEIRVQTNPAEVARLLDLQWVRNFDFEWWTDTDRAKDIWPGLCTFLRCDIDDAGAEETDFPVVDDLLHPPGHIIKPRILCLAHLQGVADCVPGGLTLGEAYGCAHELTNLIRVNAVLQENNNNANEEEDQAVNQSEDVDNTRAIFNSCAAFGAGGRVGGMDSLVLELVPLAELELQSQEQGSEAFVSEVIFDPTDMPNPLPRPLAETPSILRRIAEEEEAAAAAVATAATEQKHRRKSNVKVKKVKTHKTEQMDHLLFNKASRESEDGSAPTVSYATDTHWEKLCAVFEDSLSKQTIMFKSGNSAAAVAPGPDEEMRHLPSAANKHALLPRLCEYGRKGLWFPPPHRQPKEYTRVCGHFFRDNHISSSNSVTVLLTLALDTPVQFPTMVAWETFQTYPPRAPFEVVPDTVGTLSMYHSQVALHGAGNAGDDGAGGMVWFTHSRSLFKEPFVSNLDMRLSNCVNIFTGSADEGYDFASSDLQKLTQLATTVTYATSSPKSKKSARLTLLESSGGQEHLQALASSKRPKSRQKYGNGTSKGVANDHDLYLHTSSFRGSLRQMPSHDDKGFRLRSDVFLLGIDPVVHTCVFGVTDVGTHSNTPAVNPRSVWHGTLAIVEHINRPRLSADYHHMLLSYKAAQENEACAFCVKLHGQEFVGLVPTASKAFQAEYTEIDERRKMYARQLALDAKIEASEMQLRLKDREVLKSMQKEMQKAIERKLRRGTRSERGWNRRYHMSTLLEVQGCWERRRDDRTGMCFFHKLESFENATKASTAKKFPVRKEQYLQTCQWEVPSNWDGDVAFEERVLKNQAIAQKTQLAAAAGAGKEDPQLDAIITGRKGERGTKAAATARSTDDDSDFAEPDDTWIPSDQPGQAPNNTFGIAPRRFHRPTKKNMAHKVPKPFMNADGSIINNDMSGILDHVETAEEEEEQEADDLEEATELDVLSMKQKAKGKKDKDKDKGKRGSVISLGSQTSRLAASDTASGAGVGSVGTVQLEHIAEQLISSDELMRVLAKRLGLDAQLIVPAEDVNNDPQSTMGRGGSAVDLMSVASSETGSGRGISPLKAPRGKKTNANASTADMGGGALIERESDSGGDFDSDDDLWSEEEDVEVGDIDDLDLELKGVTLATDYGEMATLKRANNKAFKSSDEQTSTQKHLQNLAKTQGTHIPFLNLADNEVGSAGFDYNFAVAQWRRLPRPTIGKTFFTKCTERKTLGPDEHGANTLNAAVALVPINAVEAVQYVPDPFTADYKAIFIPNSKKDLERQLATLARNIAREEILTENIPTDDLILFGDPSEQTRLDKVVMKQHKDDQTATKDVLAAAVDKALWAAKGGNIAALEDALEEQIPIDTTDQFGNSLLLLAAQQGSKRMIKFLLRRGANMDWQNTTGNTALHYCFAYNNAPLGEYLKKRGANDSLLNVDGLTCYEGLSKEYLKEPGDPDSDEENDETAQMLEWK